MQTLKSFFVFVVILFASLHSKAQELQLSNPGFESWTTHPVGSFELPTGSWKPYVTSIVPGSPFIVTGQKSTDAYSGSYALRLTPSTPDGSSSQLLSFEDKYIQFPAQPSHLTGYYKFETTQNDKVSITVELVKAMSEWNITVAQGTYTVNSTSTSYQAFELPILYFNDNQLPDSLQIRISTLNGKTNEGTTLWIDDLKFLYEPLILTSNITSMSNTHLFHIEKGNVKLTDDYLTAHWHLFDLNGQTLKNSYDTSSINFSELPEGLYLLQVQTLQGETHVIKVLN